MLTQLTVYGATSIAAIGVLFKLFEYNPWISLIQSIFSAINASIFSRPIKYFYSMMYGIPIEPYNLNYVTKEWLNYVLKDYFIKQCKAPETRKVIDFRVIPFADGAMGESGRILLTYNEANLNPKLPDSIVCKLCRKDLKFRIVNVNGAVYKEILFYQTFTGVTPLRMPKLIFSNLDGFFWHAHDYVLLTEDIQPAETIINGKDIRTYFEGRYKFQDTSVTRPCLNMEDVENVVKAITEHHAYFINNDSIITQKNEFLGPGLLALLNTNYSRKKFVAERKKFSTFLQSLAWPMTKNRQKKGEMPSTPWPNEFVNKIDKMCANLLENILLHEDEMECKWPVGPCHGDLQPMNILKKTDGTKELVFIDFQLTQFMEGHLDLSYFLQWVFPPEIRKVNEERLVKLSYDIMINGGMDGSIYPFSLYFLRYKVLGAYALGRMCISCGNIEGEKDLHLVAMLYESCNAFLNDHGDMYENWKESVRIRKELLNLKKKRDAVHQDDLKSSY